ncbi:MAG: peroxide stress protein YaaA [Lachnospiraceae bacterium]|nr:peroxide stress protein YaaA [Lachnospiraceae bacterium]
MKIIISPAKKMNIDTDTLSIKDQPVFLEETREIMNWMKTLTYGEAQELWGCNGRLAELNYRRFQEMDLERNLTPALLSYEGIQYQYMAPSVFTEKEWGYVQEHLRILSGFYGVLRPLDGVVPYRLEMQAKANVNGTKNLYEFWGEKLYREIFDEKILNLASKEYSKCIEKHLTSKSQYLTCVFGEWKEDRVIQKGTQAKMARGEMVRFLAEKEITDFKEIKKFDRLGYAFSEEISSEKMYYFIKEENKDE